jgi:hypothetical protein
MLNKTMKILLGVALLPFCAGFTWQLGGAVFSMAYKPDLPYYFLAGGLAYLSVHLLFKKPILTYVFGHELTHAFFAVLFGGSVKSFQASERGGRVTITKSNFIITLAPYFFPLYTFIALIFYALAAAADVRWAAGWSIFFAGASFYKLIRPTSKSTGLSFPIRSSIFSTSCLRPSSSMRSSLRTRASSFFSEVV